MTDSKIGSIRRKIEKLKRLGEHPASDPNEAAAALALAQRLMDEHGIAEAVLGIDEHDGADEQVNEELAGSDPWRGWILSALCTANGCTSTRNTRQRAMRVFGRRGDVETVAYLFRFCVAEVERLAHRNARGRGRGYACDYRKGAALAIGQAIKAETARGRAAARAQYANDSRALVAIDSWEQRGRDALAARARMFPRLGSARAVGIGGSGGYDAGRRDGASVYGSRSSGAIGGGSLRIGSGS